MHELLRPSGAGGRKVTLGHGEGGQVHSEPVLRAVAETVELFTTQLVRPSVDLARDVRYL